MSYAWDLDNNGSFETAGQSATFSAAALDGPSSHTIRVQATDPGGLTAVSQATVNVLNVAPTVGAPAISPAPSLLNQAATASASFIDPAPNDAPFTCTVDYGDGSGAQAGTVSGSTCTGPAHAYTAVGSYTVLVSVTDKDGGTGTSSVGHNVIYNFTGFFEPVVNQPAFNQVKAGSSVPIKFSLNGDQGLDILASGYPKSQSIACDTSAPVTGLETASNPSSSGLSYDASTDRYNFVWKTNKSWAGSCRLFILRLKDGSEYYLNFKFS